MVIGGEEVEGKREKDWIFELTNFDVTKSKIVLNKGEFQLPNVIKYHTTLPIFVSWKNNFNLLKKLNNNTKTK